MRKRDYINENIGKLLGSEMKQGFLSADDKADVLKNLLRRMDMETNEPKTTRFSLKFKIASAIAAIIIIVCGIYLFSRPAENKKVPERIITKEIEEQKTIIPDTPKKINTENETTLSINPEQLAAAGDIKGLIAVLDKGDLKAKTAAANYLAKLGAIEAIESLERQADSWQGEGENPFTDAVEKIKSVQNTKPTNDIKKTDEPNNAAGGGVKSSDPNDPNNWPFMEIWVTDKQTNEPIKDVRVKGSASKKKAVTDHNGYCRVTLGKKPKSDYFSVNVEKEGYSLSSFKWGKDLGRAIPSEYEFFMEKGTVIGGIIRNESGEAVPDANVAISYYSQLESNNENEPIRVFDNYMVKADINGKWSCDIIPAELSDDGQISIRIKHRDYADYQVWERQRTAGISQLRNAEFVSVLKKGTVIYGYILDNANRPIEKADVYIGYDRYVATNLKTQTDRSGYFEFAHSEQGFNIITVIAQGYAPQMKELNVSDNMQQEENFILTPGNIIRGYVVDVNGNPIVKATVNADEWRNYRMINWSGKTDKNGKFVWDSAPADEVKFTIYKDKYMGAGPVLTPSEQEYRIVLPPPLVIYGDILDAETNEPIKENVSITPGAIWKPNENLVWQNSFSWIKYFKDGKYEILLTTPAQGYALKLDINDRRQAISRTFDSNEGRVKYDFVLNRADGLSGVVYNPDGNPCDNATVYLVVKNQWLYLENGKQRYQQEIEKTITNSQGKFNLPDCNEKFKLVAVSDEGFADVNSSEFLREPAIHLEKWGRIEGIVYVGSKLAANQEIMVNNSAKSNNPDRINYNYSSKAMSDENGKFVIEKIIPGKNNVYKMFRFGESSSSSMSVAARQNIDVLPGQTTEVVLGGTGRIITGKILWPSEEFYKKVIEISANIQSQPSSNQQALMEQAYSQAGEMPRPADFDSMTAKQAVEWYKNWSQSNDGKAYYAKIQEAMVKAGVKTNINSGGIIVDSNGSFRGEDIEEGDYVMTVSVMERKGRYGQADYQNPLLRGKYNFTIPTVTDLNIDQPLDLGEISLEVISNSQPLVQDNNAPDFTLETSTGTVKLTDLRGKYVVLVFWNCMSVLSDDKQEAWMENILNAYNQYGSTGNVEFIGISVSSKYYNKIYIGIEIAEKYLREKQCNWKQAFVDFDDAMLREYRKYRMNGNSAVMLIDGNGRVVSADMTGKQLVEILGSN